jgi:hypothetical protein
MQLHLEIDELNLLANLLMEPTGEIPRPAVDGRLLDMVLARDLRFDSDELERLAALLFEAERRAKDDLLNEKEAACRFELKSRLALLDRVMEKVDEACVMI